MKFFVNFLSAFRIVSAFVIILTFMFGMPITTFVIFVLAALTDFFDGFLARKYNVCTKIGAVMDSTGDKLLVTNAFILLAIQFHTWFIVLPIIIMISRELYISGLREFLGRLKMEMPVPKNRFSMGKIKATLQMISIAAFFARFAISPLISLFPTNKIIIYTALALPEIATITLLFAMIASIWSAIEYTIEFSKKIKK